MTYADLAKVPVQCKLYGTQPFSRCRSRCVEKCQAYNDMEDALRVHNAIKKGERRKAWWSARKRAQKVDEQIEQAYLSRSDEKAMMGDWR